MTSTRPSEGKTTIAGCLAVAAALAGLRVLFIDGDLRRHSTKSTDGRITGIGFAEMLDGEMAIADTLRSAEFFDRERGRCVVSFLCANRKSATFLAGVDWRKARTALQSVALNFDFVLLDSPPILAANDALLFANLADRILLVIGANASADEVRRAKQRLDSLGTPIVGAVLDEFGSDGHRCPVQPYRGYTLL